MYVARLMCFGVFLYCRYRIDLHVLRMPYKKTVKLPGTFTSYHDSIPRLPSYISVSGVRMDGGETSAFETSKGTFALKQAC